MGRFITYIGSPCSAMRKAQQKQKEQEEQKPIYVPKVGDILVHNSETNEDKVVPYSKWLQLEDSWDIVGLYGITTYEEENAENGYYVIMSNGTTLIIAPEDYEKVNTNWEQVDTVIVPTSITRTLTCTYVPIPSGGGSGSGSGSGDSSTKLFDNGNFADSIESMTIDGNEQSSIINSYDFGDTNEHTVVFTLKDSVTSIGEGAFNSCDKLISVTIPKSITSIGDQVFNYCKNLTSIDIPNSVTSIGDGAFNACSSLTNITIPNSVTTIDQNAFNTCQGLTSINIPDGVTSIGKSVFYGCSGLTSITVDANNANYSSEDGVLFNKTKTTLIYYPIGNTRTSYNMPNSVTSIGERAFYNYTGLRSVTISDNITSIDRWAFSGCNSLTSVNIPNSITSIGENAFSYCGGIVSVTIGSGVTSIGGQTFYLCTNIESITINATTPPELGNHAFSGSTCPIYVP